MKAELAVIGGGPAGLSAAIEAAKNGVNVVLFDENKKAGGQLFKQIHRFFGSEEHLAGTRGIEIGKMLLDEARKYSVKVMLDNVVWGLFPDLKLGISDSESVSIFEADKVIVATGGCENSLSFPGWTLPNIMSAGAAQTLINVDRVLPGRRAVIIGSGNVGLIVAYQLIQVGVTVEAVIEILPEIGGYGVHASKILRMGVPILTSHMILKAEGESFVESIEIASIDSNFKKIDGSEKRINVDFVCIAVGLRPLTELCYMAGTRFEYIPELGGFVPVHNENMQTTINDLYVSGDVTGIEEASTAIEEGKLAGIAVSKDLNKVSSKRALKMIDESKKRLDTLRMGPFGDYRNEAKNKIFKKFYQ